MKNEAVFPQLVEAHYAALYRFALSLAKSPADASDLTQQTFLFWAIYRGKRQLRAALKLHATEYRATGSEALVACP